MTATLATLDPIMKEVYQPRIREQLNTETVALKRVEGSSAGVTNEVGGKYVTFPLHTRRNSGVGSRFENEALPAPGQQGYAAARVGLKYAYGSIQLTGQAISLSDSNAQAFARALDQEVSGVKDDILKDLNRQIYGSGNGAISTVTGANTGAVVPVADARLFQVGELVDIINGTTVSTSKTVVNSVDLTAGANTITLSAAPGTATAAGYLVVRSGSGPAASGNRELTGLGAIVSDTGTIYNVNPATEPLWKAVVNGNGGTPRALSEGLIINLVDQIRTNGGKTTLLLTSLGVRRAYFALLSQLRSVVNTQDFTGGFKGLAFTTDMGEVPLVSDPDAPLGKLWAINEEALTVYRDEDWHWLDRDQMWHQVVDSTGTKDAWFATMARYHELGTDRRNSHGLITDIAEA